jgi:hypothetical protein
MTLAVHPRWARRITGDRETLKQVRILTREHRSVA